MIELDRLSSPLRGLPDDPDRGGVPGHVAIAPVDAVGAVDLERLTEWAAYRGTGNEHPFTQIIRKAIVREIKGKR